MLILLFIRGAHCRVVASRDCYRLKSYLFHCGIFMICGVLLFPIHKYNVDPGCSGVPGFPYVWPYIIVVNQRLLPSPSPLCIIVTEVTGEGRACIQEDLPKA